MKAGYDRRQITKLLERNKSAISRELKRNSSSRGYRSNKAHVMTHSKPAQVILLEKLTMIMTMEDDIKRWTAKRKAALVMEIIQGKTSISEASRAFDVSPAEIEEWVDEAKRGMENALRAKPLDIKEQYERQLKELQEAYGEAMLELRARKKYQALLDKEDEK
jgi:transposase-like protein